MIIDLCLYVYDAITRVNTIVFILWIKTYEPFLSHIISENYHLYKLNDTEMF